MGVLASWVETQTLFGKKPRRHTGAGLSEKLSCRCEGEVFSLDIPFYRTRPAFSSVHGYHANTCRAVAEDALNVAAESFLYPGRMSQREL